MKFPRNVAGKWAHRAKGSADAYVDGMLTPRALPNPEFPAFPLGKSGKAYVESIDAGRKKYARQWRRYRAILERVILPPRKPMGHPGNYQRVLAICAALHQEKMRGATPAQRARHRRIDCTLCKYRVRLKGA